MFNLQLTTRVFIQLVLIYFTINMVQNIRLYKDALNLGQHVLKVFKKTRSHVPDQNINNLQF